MCGGACDECVCGGCLWLGLYVEVLVMGVCGGACDGGTCVWGVV